MSYSVWDTQRRPGSRQGCLRGRHQPSSRGFPGSEPNSDQGDHSRLSCSAGIRSSGLGSARMRWRGVRAGVRGIGDRARAKRGQMLLYKMTERIPFLGEPTHRGERYPPVAPWHSVRDKGTNVGTPTDRGDDACAVSQTKLPAGLTWPKNYYRSWLISIGCRSSLGRLSTSTSETIPMWQRAQGATLIIPRPCRGTRADAYGPHGTQLQGFRAL